MEIWNSLDVLIKAVKESPVASLVFTLIVGGLVWLFKKSETLLADNEKMAKADLKEQIIQFSVLESYVALFLQDPSATNREKMFEKLGVASFFMPDKLKLKQQEVLTKPTEVEVKHFLVELQEVIKSLRNYVVRNEHLFDIQSIPERAWIVVKEVGRTVGTIALIGISLLFAAVFFGVLYDQWEHATSIFLRINLLFASMGGTFAALTFIVAAQTPISKLELKTALITMALSLVAIGCFIFVTSLSIPIVVLQVYGLRKLMHSIN